MPTASLNHLANGEGAGSHRNGSSRKTVLTPGAEMRLTIPRDGLGSFELKLVANHQRRMAGFYGHAFGMGARGMNRLPIACQELTHVGIKITQPLFYVVKLRSSPHEKRFLP